MVVLAAWCLGGGFLFNYDLRAFMHYVCLLRRRRGPTAVVRGLTIDNRWVVPYNPALSAKYKCHINVEYCASIQ